MRKDYIYPQTWKCGPDEDRHQVYQRFLMHREWAKKRGEPYNLTFEDFWEVLSPPDDPEKWKRHGRKGGCVSVFRLDKTEPWSRHNLIACTMLEHRVLRKLKRLHEKYHKLELEIEEARKEVDDLVRKNALPDARID